jgi:hypothetical protein
VFFIDPFMVGCQDLPINLPASGRLMAGIPVIDVSNSAPGCGERSVCRPVFA